MIVNNLANLRGQFAAILTRDEMKNVVGGVLPPLGSRCVLYCCDNEGDCTPSGYVMPGVTQCSTNEECQNLGNGQGYTCPQGYYVAALCKG